MDANNENFNTATIEFDEGTVDVPEDVDLEALGLLDGLSAGQEETEGVSEAEDEKPEDEEPEGPMEEPEGPTEGAEAKEETADDQDDAPQVSIPKARLDKEIAKRRELEERLAEMEHQMRLLNIGREPQKDETVAEEPPAGFDFDAAEKDYMEAILDGETDRALEIRKEINRELEAKFRTTTSTQIETVKQQEAQIAEFQRKAMELTEAYPIFNEKSPEFSQEALDNALLVRDSLIKSGMSPVEAVEKAAKIVGGTPKAAQQAAKPKNEDAVKRKLEVATKQPPKTSGGKRGESAEATVDPTKMTQDQWEKLPLDVQNRLLGII